MESSRRKTKCCSLHTVTFLLVTLFLVLFGTGFRILGSSMLGSRQAGVGKSGELDGLQAVEPSSLRKIWVDLVLLFGPSAQHVVLSEGRQLAWLLWTQGVPGKRVFKGVEIWKVRQPGWWCPSFLFLQFLIVPNTCALKVTIFSIVRCTTQGGGAFTVWCTHPQVRLRLHFPKGTLWLRNTNPHPSQRWRPSSTAASGSLCKWNPRLCPIAPGFCPQAHQGSLLPSPAFSRQMPYPGMPPRRQAQAACTLADARWLFAPGASGSFCWDRVVGRMFPGAQGTMGWGPRHPVRPTFLCICRQKPGFQELQSCGITPPGSSQAGAGPGGPCGSDCGAPDRALSLGEMPRTVATSSPFHHCELEHRP